MTSEHGMAGQLGTLPLLAAEDTAVRHFLSAGSEWVAQDKGRFLLAKRHLVPGLYGVLEGSVKVVLLSPQGNERVVEIPGPGELPGDVIVFSSAPCPICGEVLTRL